jgi:TrmH family RNA methyltransferase
VARAGPNGDRRRIASTDNPKLKYTRRLVADKAFRRRERRFVLEGRRLIRDGLDAGVVPSFALYGSDFDDRTLVERLRAVAPVFEVPASLLASVADTVTPQGVLAVVPWVEPAPAAGAPLVVVLDGVHDPGNAGAILRTAAAAGATAAVLAPETADLYNPKVVRAAMGAHFRLPARQLDWDATAAAVAGLAVVVADARDGTPYTAIAWRAPTALVIGGEARGLSVEAETMATVRAHIPMARATESLNAAAAAAVLLFEAARQRAAL